MSASSHALVRCNSISCYNELLAVMRDPDALVRCNSISCYNDGDIEENPGEP